MFSNGINVNIMKFYLSMIFFLFHLFYTSEWVSTSLTVTLIQVLLLQSHKLI